MIPKNLSKEYSSSSRHIVKRDSISSTDMPKTASTPALKESFFAPFSPSPRANFSSSREMVPLPSKSKTSKMARQASFCTVFCRETSASKKWSKFTLPVPCSRLQSTCMTSSMFSLSVGTRRILSRTSEMWTSPVPSLFSLWKTARKSSTAAFDSSWALSRCSTFCTRLRAWKLRKLFSCSTDKWFCSDCAILFLMSLESHGCLVTSSAE
mmetsp:Transcript_62066/g.172016  ORF Transcript_62066/g.172016 Transcript_62066/m.172016 type:complete len:210 (-) Transcript_62066:2272-2901(-)